MTPKSQPAEERPNLHSTDGASDKSLPPWERSTLGRTWRSSEEKYEIPFNFRITSSQYRALQKIVQHKIHPYLETYSDLGRTGLNWVEWWVTHQENFPVPEDLRDYVDTLLWEAAVEAREHYVGRMTSIVDRLEKQLEYAVESRQPELLETCISELVNNKPKVKDKNLQTRMNRLWLKYREKLTELKE